MRQRCSSACKIYGGYVPRGVLPCSKKETRIFHDSMVVREKNAEKPKREQVLVAFFT